jgi:hypothetical protein
VDCFFFQEPVEMEDSGTESDDETETEQGEEADSDSKSTFSLPQIILPEPQEAASALVEIKPHREF